VLPFEHDGTDYAIYRSPDDLYYATDGHCTDERTLLCDGLVMGDTIECPKHNGRLSPGPPRCGNLATRHWPPWRTAVHGQR
jgi:3-phenylpropionate/trans-cinnamate dioxygenase ferredoxin subunit